jgi:hypothetical protein
MNKFYAKMWLSESKINRSGNRHAGIASLRIVSCHGGRGRRSRRRELPTGHRYYNRVTDSIVHAGSKVQGYAKFLLSISRFSTILFLC